MANTIQTSDIAVPFVAQAEHNMNILMNGTNTYNKNFKGGNGSSMSVLIPDSGTTTKGADLTGKIQAYANGKKEVTLTHYSKGVELTAVEQSLEMASFDEQIAEGYGGQLASTIQTAGADELLTKADTAVIVSTATGAYKDIGRALANIRQARAYGQFFGALEPILSDDVQNSGLSLFQADLKEDFLTGKIGKFRNARWYESPDIRTLVTGSHTDEAGAVKTTVNTNGASTITIKSLTDTDEFVVGEIFTIASASGGNVKAVDIYGKAITSDYAFVVLAPSAPETSSGDWVAGTSDGDDPDAAYLGKYVVGTTTTGEMTVNIKPLYFTGAMKNVSAVATADQVVTFLTDGDTTYLRGVAWCKATFVTGSAPASNLKLSQTKQFGIMGQGSSMSLIAQTGTDAVKGVDIVRFEGLHGFLLGRSNWASAILVKLS